ncbi:hypothetical protein [Microbacterium hominis]|uniref:Uncharacterized protein n=1 Tax=Microbacterium hominis TaxID=162426 RepID=A0A7D4QDG5_9MICO|nr:hypothetical protein [Microbacterium hominis]QKJ20177.1 hypothetical protein HQM25_12940 [Microbacterium hominis]
MYATIHAAEIMYRHEADALARDLEHLQHQRERHDVGGRPTGFAVVTEGFWSLLQHLARTAAGVPASAH